MLNCKIYVEGQGYIYPHELLKSPVGLKPLDQLFYDASLKAKVEAMRQNEPIVWPTKQMSMAEIKEEKGKRLFTK